MKKLKEEGRLVHQSTFSHSYPFCWRSETPLLYKAVPSWFIRVEAIIPQLLENNQKCYWVPEFVREKRFHNWLKDARDWAVSRNRYWGTPMPLWVSEDFSEVGMASIQTSLGGCGWGCGFLLVMGSLIPDFLMNMSSWRSAGDQSPLSKDLHVLYSHVTSKGFYGESR